MGDRLATIDMGRKLGAVPPFWVGELGPHLTQCGLDRGLPSYQVASWYIQAFGHNTHGRRKVGGGCCALFSVRGAGSPSNTMSLGPRPTSLPSGILIYPAVWPQQTWAENWGGSAPLGKESWVLGPHLTQCGQGRVLPPCQVSSWSIQPFSHNTPTLETDR